MEILKLKLRFALRSQTTFSIRQEQQKKDMLTEREREGGGELAFSKELVLNVARVESNRLSFCLPAHPLCLNFLTMQMLWVSAVWRLYRIASINDTNCGLIIVLSSESCQPYESCHATKRLLLCLLSDVKLCFLQFTCFLVPFLFSVLILHYFVVYCAFPSITTFHQLL